MDVPRSVHGPRRDAVASGESARATLIQDRRMRRSPSNTMAGVRSPVRIPAISTRVGTLPRSIRTVSTSAVRSRRRAAQTPSAR